MYKVKGYFLSIFYMTCSSCKKYLYKMFMIHILISARIRLCRECRVGGVGSATPNKWPKKWSSLSAEWNDFIFTTPYPPDTPDTLDTKKKLNIYIYIIISYYNHIIILKEQKWKYTWPLTPDTKLIYPDTPQHNFYTNWLKVIFIIHHGTDGKQALNFKTIFIPDSTGLTQEPNTKTWGN